MRSGNEVLKGGRLDDKIREERIDDG